MAGATGSNGVDKESNSVGVLYLIGLGLGDEKDISMRGLECVRKAKRVYLEAYTSILGVNKDRLEKLYGCELTIADREMVEERSDDILGDAKHGVAFLVVGDPFGATTHSDLWLRAREQGISVEVVHNASIMNAVACCGLQLYRFGQAISLCFWSEYDRPTSYFLKLMENRRSGLHTLCLLDIKVKEPSLQGLARGKKIYEPPRFMSIAQAVEQLLTIAAEEDGNDINEDTYGVGVARLGQRDQCIVYATLRELGEYEFGAPLHSLVIPASTLHFHEDEVLRHFRVST